MSLVLDHPTGVCVCGMNVTRKNCDFIEKIGIDHNILTTPFTKSDLHKLSEEALVTKNFSIIPIIKFVLKAEICSNRVVKAIEKASEAQGMVNAISEHLKCLEMLETRKEKLRAVRMMGAELVKAAIEEEISQLVDLFLGRLEIESGIFDISDLMVRKGLWYKPQWLSLMFKKGVSLDICQQNPVEVVLGKSYTNPAVKLDMIRVLLENGASLPNGAHTATILNDVVECTIKCANATVDTLTMVCERLDFVSQPLCDKERSPWHLALRCKRNRTSIAICTVLSKYQINPDQKDKNGRRADWGMKESDERVKLFRAKVTPLARNSEIKRHITTTTTLTDKADEDTQYCRIKQKAKVSTDTISHEGRKKQRIINPSPITFNESIRNKQRSSTLQCDNSETEDVKLLALVTHQWIMCLSVKVIEHYGK